MELSTDWVDLKHNGEVLKGFLVKPKGSPKGLSAIIVIHEIFGADEHIIDVAKRYAQSGYLVIAPDLYSTGITKITPENLKLMKCFMEVVPSQKRMDQNERAKWPEEIRETFETLAPTTVFGPQPEKTNKMVQDLEAWAGYLESQGVTKIGSVGFCLGGGLSFHFAARYTKLRGAVVYYGDSPNQEQMKSIQCPVLGYFGGIDYRITDKVPAAQEAMNDLGKEYTTHIYDGVDHGFFNDTRKSYDVHAARDSWARTLFFFNEVLT